MERRREGERERWRSSLPEKMLSLNQLRMLSCQNEAVDND